MNIIFGQVRFVYNLGLETKIAAYTSNKVNLTCIDLSNQIKQLKDFFSNNDCLIKILI